MSVVAVDVVRPNLRFGCQEMSTLTSEYAQLQVLNGICETLLARAVMPATIEHPCGSRRVSPWVLAQPSRLDLLHAAQRPAIGTQLMVPHQPKTEKQIVYARFRRKSC
uniref:Uncharacterized protein n=1 Tax=Noctiluca scintillans TaxID=2966 RepID=A0A7S1ACC1_NOCSC